MIAPAIDTPTECRACDEPMVPRRTTAAGRVSHFARGLCVTCYQRARRHGRLDQYEPLGVEYAAIPPRWWHR